jgi:hypothetical protein
VDRKARAGMSARRLRDARRGQIASMKPKHECTTNQQYPQNHQEHEVTAKGAENLFHSCCLTPREPDLH